MTSQDAVLLSIEEFVEDVRAGLGRAGQKGIPPKYLYDEVGSALFEVISVLPEYGLTRADERLLRRHAAEIADLIPAATVAELGSGTGKKTRWILDAIARRFPVVYYPIELSASALARCQRDLGDMDCVRVLPLQTEYLDGVAEVARRRKPGGQILVLFLGSTIGNFDRDAGTRFLAQLRTMLIPGDGLLLSTDLEKSTEQLLAAYDDPLGVTAAFNLNLLARINRELEADFELAQFQHLTLYNQEERRIEMHIRSKARQVVRVRRAELSVSLEEGETIWTESCHKYDPEEVVRMANQDDFGCRAQWIDDQWPFAQTLFVAK